MEEAHLFLFFGFTVEEGHEYQNEHMKLTECLVFPAPVLDWRFSFRHFPMTL